MSKKNRTPEEVVEILSEFEKGSSIYEVSERFGISQAAFYRLLKVSRGEPADAKKFKEKSQLRKLEGKLKEREKEIALLRAALKKS